MIGYVTMGTNDLARAATFYDAIAAELGVSRMMEFDNFIAWGKEGGGAGIGLTRPFDGNPATVGNGVMVALEARDAEQVQRLHAIALANGGTVRRPAGTARRRLLRRSISATPTVTSSTLSSWGEEPQAGGFRTFPVLVAPAPSSSSSPEPPTGLPIA